MTVGPQSVQANAAFTQQCAELGVQPAARLYEVWAELERCREHQARLLARRRNNSRWRLEQRICEIETGHVRRRWDKLLGEAQRG